MVNFEERTKALADYLGISVDDIEISEDNYRDDMYAEYITPDGDYVVMTEDEAEQAVKERVEQDLYEFGLDAFSDSFREWILENAVVSDWFSDACKESYEFYANDIAEEYDEDYGTRLAQECVDAGIISEDDFVDGEYVGDLNLEEELAEYLYNRTDENYNGNFYNWYVDNFGNEGLKDLIESGSVNFDIDKISDSIIDTDGYGPSIAWYDGETIELATDGYIDFYAFRIN